MPFKEKFIAGAVEKGYPDKLAADLFELIVPFADYGFNASHACAYGLVAYQTAYLMAHHRVEYMSAVLTSVKDDKDRKPFYLNACRGMGIEVLPPDVNELRARLRAGAGRRAVDPVRAGGRAQRGRGRRRSRSSTPAGPRGRSTSYADFCRKVEPSVLTKRVLESLILAGAFDSLGYTRRALLEHQDRVSAPIARRAEGRGGRAVLALRRRRRPRRRRTGRRVRAAGRGVRQARCCCDSRRRCSGSS